MLGTKLLQKIRSRGNAASQLKFVIRSWAINPLQIQDAAWKNLRQC